MSTVLLRLAGPMQSWGTQSRFGQRDTGLEPSKSGVVGLLCCALGWQREADTFTFRDSELSLEAFARGLSMAVRVDREGRMSRDFHTAQEVLRSDRSGRADTVLSERFYLADAEFVVGLSHGSEPLLRQIDEALQEPVWPLFLGRKSFVPGDRLPAGISPAELLAAVSSLPWHPGRGRIASHVPERLRMVVETPPGRGAEVRQDVPISFGYQRRRFATRHVETLFLPDSRRGLALPQLAQEEA